MNSLVGFQFKQFIFTSSNHFPWYFSDLKFSILIFEKSSTSDCFAWFPDCFLSIWFQVLIFLTTADLTDLSSTFFFTMSPTRRKDQWKKCSSSDKRRADLRTDAVFRWYFARYFPSQTKDSWWQYFFFGVYIHNLKLALCQKFFFSKNFH